MRVNGYHVAIVLVLMMVATTGAAHIKVAEVASGPVNAYGNSGPCLGLAMVAVTRLAVDVEVTCGPTAYTFRHETDCRGGVNADLVCDVPQFHLSLQHDGDLVYIEYDPFQGQRGSERASASGHLLIV